MDNDTEVQTNLKIPKSLKNKLKVAAKENHRSMTAELVSRLESTFEAPGRYEQHLRWAAGNLDPDGLDDLLSKVGAAALALQDAADALGVADHHVHSADREERQTAEQQGKADDL